MLGHREVKGDVMDGAERVQPDSRYYLIAFLFLAVGVGLTIYSFVSGIRRIRENMVRMDLPGQMDLELKGHETYTVFIEHETSDGRLSAGSKVNCQASVLPSGERIDGIATGITHTYTYGSRTGVSVLEFEAPHDGTYTLICQTSAAIAGQKMDAAIGGGSSRGINIVLVRSFVTLIVGVVVAALMFARVAMLRLESRNEIRERGLKPV
jgi:hypothetical protein